MVLLREAAVAGGGGGERGAGAFEVYLVRRPKRAGFMPDSHVFPGGKVEDIDAAPALGGDAGVAAAVREAFEECGVLLCDDAQGRPAGALPERFAGHRRALQAGDTTWEAILAEEGLRVAPQRLARWAHWITPSVEPVRFSARFFLARLPVGQVAAHAEGELTDELWATPAEILDLEQRGVIRLPPPTYFTVFELSRLSNLADVDRAAARRTVITILPKLIDFDGARTILLPWDRDYAAASGDGLAPPSADRETFAPPPWSRHVLDGGRWWRR